MLNNIFTNYFGFNKQQRNGLGVLLCVIFFLLIVRLIYPSFIKSDPIVIKNLPMVDLPSDSDENSQQQNLNENTRQAVYFVFDPNTVTKEELIKLGFREKTASVFLKFRSKGFIFREKKDLKKIYGVSETQYAALESFIIINKIESTKSARQNSQERKIVPIQNVEAVELNSADSTKLVNIIGIGPGYAARILKYRSALGGFVNTDQLKEVYGFPPELYDKIKNNITVNEGNVRKLNLNKDDFKTLNKHPYISYELTKIICDWRRKTTLTATNLNEIINDPALSVKLLPYLAFE